MNEDIFQKIKDFDFNYQASIKAMELFDITFSKYCECLAALNPVYIFTSDSTVIKP